MKEYGFETQKGKIIRMMIMQGADCWYEDFELERLGNIFVGNNSGARLSQLKKDGVVDVMYYENPNGKITNTGYFLRGYKRAKYRLKPELVEFYRELYLLEMQKEVLEYFEEKQPWYKRIFRIN